MEHRWGGWYVTGTHGAARHMGNVIAIETDRYIAWPAQALCYKVGQRAIERTRAAIEKRDGDKFDIKSFHDHAIGHGQIPLPVFEAEMPNWVKPKA